jgi:lysophospholipase L1-like esterase
MDVKTRMARWYRRLWMGVLALMLLAAMLPTEAEAASSPATLYALGDSTGAGVGAREGSYVDRLLRRIAESGRAFRLQNLSGSGATTADVLRDQVGKIRPGARGLVLIGIGANDLTGGLPPEVFARQFATLVASVRAKTDAPIVVSNVPDVSLAKAIEPASRPQIAARVDAYNGAIAKLARERGLVVFDLCALSRATLPAHPEYLSFDGYHPSDSGYEAWAAALWEVVRRVL